ncbi:MAG: hypothetical protein CW335_01735 [Clostridiales bacterium]|nr:hypothetical protein [Clostridiales bacterium]
MYKYRRLIISLIAGLLVLSFIAGFVVMAVNAKTSAEIQAEIDELEGKSDELEEQRSALESQIAENESRTLNVVEQKAQVDQEIELTRLEIENVTEQVHQYNMLISEKQAELDELQGRQDELFERYKLRMRAMQERGEVSFWSVLLDAESFADMLNCRAMIEEIAKTDQRMMDEMRQLAAEVISAKEDLAAQKIILEGKKAELTEAQQTLDEKRAESDQLLSELVADKIELVKLDEEYEAQLTALTDEIADLEAEKTAALQREWEAAHPPQPTPDNPNPAPVYPSSGEGFMFPLDYSGYACVTSSYGYRVHPITGNYTMHNGVDLAANQGTAIYATKSGYVTTATYNYAYGNYVTINHMDGFSSLYGHMTYFVVNDGDFVSQGQVIGYVGSTGYSTGPHLHFTVYYNGDTVNPMNYISG